MPRQGKESKRYRTKILQISIYSEDTLEMTIGRDEKSKLKYTELKYWSCQYAEARKAKTNIQK